MNPIIKKCFLFLITLTILSSQSYGTELKEEYSLENSLKRGSFRDFKDLFYTDLGKEIVKYIPTKLNKERGVGEINRKFHSIVMGSMSSNNKVRRGTGNFRVIGDDTVTNEKILAFRYVKKLHVEDLPLVNDVSQLGKVKSLALIDLPGVSDVSQLGQVKSLGLYRLPLVSDVSQLGQVEFLTLCGLPGVSDVSPLRKVKSLRLYGLPGVE